MTAAAKEMLPSKVLRTCAMPYFPPFSGSATNKEGDVYEASASVGPSMFQVIRLGIKEPPGKDGSSDIQMVL